MNRGWGRRRSLAWSYCDRCRRFLLIKHLRHRPRYFSFRCALGRAFSNRIILEQLQQLRGRGGKCAHLGIGRTRYCVLPAFLEIDEGSWGTLGLNHGWCRYVHAILCDRLYLLVRMSNRSTLHAPQSRFPSFERSLSMRR